MLWLALHFPQLPIDRQDQSDADEPRAVVLAEGTRRRILACNPTARDNGIHPGLALKNAYAIVPNLAVSEYDDTEQLAHLEQLTLWALNYSSLVSPEVPESILLEIGSSLTLFGGLETLLEKLFKGIQQQGVCLSSAIAPVPSAALLFARCDSQTPVNTPVQSSNHAHRQMLDKPSLIAALNTVPISALPLDAFTGKGLRQSGIRTLGELRALPAASLTRRFGSAITELLYKLDGRLPDPRTAYRPADTFFQAFDLPLEALDTNALAFPLNRLINALGGYLRVRDLGVRHLELILSHPRKPATRVALKFLDATASTQHLFHIAAERLNNLTIDSPVIRLALESTELATLQRTSTDLWGSGNAGHCASSSASNNASSNAGGSIEQLLDTLSARLGRNTLYSAFPDEDHRPEKAWLTALLDKQPLPGLWPARPLWLLPEARPLHEAVTLHTLPERIENGWWDDTDVRRDYFIASTQDGAYYWVYRQRHAPEQLWLHGLFA